MIFGKCQWPANCHEISYPLHSELKWYVQWKLRQVFVPSFLPRAPFWMRAAICKIVSKYGASVEGSFNNVATASVDSAGAGGIWQHVPINLNRCVSLDLPSARGCQIWDVSPQVHHIVQLWDSKDVFNILQSDYWSQWHEAAAIASRLRKSNTPKDSTPMGNNSHRSDPGNSQVESTDDKWEKLQKLIPLALKIQANASAKLVGSPRFCKLHGVFDDHTRRRIFQELCMLQQLGITGLEVCPLGALARSFWRNYCRNKNPRGQHNGKDGKLKIFCNDNLSHCLAI